MKTGEQDGLAYDIMRTRILPGNLGRVRCSYSIPIGIKSALLDDLRSSMFIVENERIGSSVHVLLS